MSEFEEATTAPATKPVIPRAAAAVVLLRDGAHGAEVFMVRRHVRSEFVPDVYVFPGGTVKSDDAATELNPNWCVAATLPAGDATAQGAGFRVAALRECFEEAGILLAHRRGAPFVPTPEEITRIATYRHALNKRTMTLSAIVEREGLRLATDALLHWAHWITPEAYPLRFDTQFFLAAAPSEQQAEHDNLETTASGWITPEAALDRYEHGDFPLVFATLHQLRALSGFATVGDAWARFANAHVRTIQPRIVVRDGVETIIVPDDPH